MLATLKFLLSIFAALPAAKGLFDDFVAFYTAHEIDKMKKENREAIRKAFDAHDQREIEKVLGSSKAGKPSGVDGAIIVDDLPGVMRDKGPG